METLINLFLHPHIVKITLLSVSGLLIRQSLVFTGQRWANTYHHLGSYILLPNIALVITSIIKDDIALSLGMIGALSIVRFRNPVKNSFELKTISNEPLEKAKNLPEFNLLACKNTAS